MKEGRKALEGHSSLVGSVSSVRFYPVGMRIMSGPEGRKEGKTVQLWDAVNGAHLNTSGDIPIGLDPDRISRTLPEAGISSPDPMMMMMILPFIRHYLASLTTVATSSTCFISFL